MLKLVFLATLLIFGTSSCGSTPDRKSATNNPNEPASNKSAGNTPLKDPTQVIVGWGGDIAVNNLSTGHIADLTSMERELTRIFEARMKSNDRNATAVLLRISSEVGSGGRSKLLNSLKKLGAEPLSIQEEKY